MATNRNFQFEGMTQIKRKLTNAGFTLIPLRHLMNEHAEVITKEAKKVAPKDTGALANSIDFKQVAMVGRLPKMIQIEATAPYSEFVHGRFRRLPSGYKPPPPKRRKNWGNPNWRTKPHYPPIQPIEDWATSRGLNTWGVVQSINERGTPLVPFLLLAEKNTRKARRKLTKKAQKQIALSWKMKR